MSFPSKEDIELAGVTLRQTAFLGVVRKIAWRRVGPPATGSGSLFSTSYSDVACIAGIGTSCALISGCRDDEGLAAVETVAWVRVDGGNVSNGKGRIPAAGASVLVFGGAAVLGNAA
jgi:hypothetical protein